MSIRNYDSTVDRQRASLGADWKDTARQQTVHLRDNTRVIVTEDKHGGVFAARTDRHGSVIARAELKAGQGSAGSEMTMKERFRAALAVWGEEFRQGRRDAREERYPPGSLAAGLTADRVNKEARAAQRAEYAAARGRRDYVSKLDR